MQKFRHIWELKEIKDIKDELKKVEGIEKRNKLLGEEKKGGKR